MQKLFALKKTIIVFFLLLTVGACFSIPNLKFSFDFSQFFPTGDADLVFYEEFIKDFSTDDNFLVIAIENKPNVFDAEFLRKFNQLTIDAKNLPFVKQANSLTNLSYPLKTGFGYTKLAVLHWNDQEQYATDWQKIKKDNLFLNAFIDTEASSLVLLLETDDNLDHKQSVELLSKTRELLQFHELEQYHLMGRSFFYEAIVSMQKRELIVTSIVALTLILIVLFIIYKRPIIVCIVLLSIFVALLLFLGVLALLGQELSVLAAFYPILMLIVGTSDVIHILDSFLEKLKKGITREVAMEQSLKEVGLVTLLTSTTTAIGFLSLLFSKLIGIREFGINAAIGVVIAYITVIFFTSALVLLFKKESLLPKNINTVFWDKNLLSINKLTLSKPKLIIISSLVFTIFCVFGITLINTNYTLKTSLPENSTIAEDFDFFQKKYAGFRSLEVAVTTKDSFKINDYKVALEIEKVTSFLEQTPAISNVQSINSIFKSFNKANNLNKSEFFVLPTSKDKFDIFKKDAQKYARKPLLKFMDSSQTKSRIISKVLDIGTDSLQATYKKLEALILAETDPSVVEFKLTGKGLLMDKNAAYIQFSILQGLLMGLILVGIIMALLFKNLRLVLLSMIPNVIPILFSGALLGYFKIPLDAPTSIIFAVVFGIAVDDTIHFLGKYKMGIANGFSKEEALETTFLKTGRALIITTLILFFGFMVLLFSIHNPSLIIGLLISATLIIALILDLLLLPVLIRKYL